MTRLGGFGLPGMGTLDQTAHRELFWGGDGGKGLILYRNAVIAGETRDAGNTPTTVLRPGLLLGLVTASGEYEEFDGDASDGSQNVAGVLETELKATDFDANNADRVCRIAVRGPVRTSQLLIQGSAFDGHADEYLARRQMVAAGFQFDDDPFGYKAGAPRTVHKITDYTVVADDNGTTFTLGTADGTFTLPSVQPGLEFEFVNTADFELVVASADGDDMIVGNDAAADSVTFTTAGEQIGARVKVRGVYVNGTAKWLVELPQAPFGTAAGSVLTIGIAT